MGGGYTFNSAEKMPDAKVVDFLKVYGNKLWSLYFKSVGAKPYGLEVQKMLIYSASIDDFMLLPHNLTISGELLLVEMQKCRKRRMIVLLYQSLNGICSNMNYHLRLC